MNQFRCPYQELCCNYDRNRELCKTYTKCPLFIERLSQSGDEIFQEIGGDGLERVVIRRKQ